LLNINMVVSLIIFVVSFVFFVYGKIHRCIVALVGATLMVVFGDLRGFYTQQQALEAIDFDTLGLLFGMMTIVVILRKTGLFRYLAIKGAKFAKGDPWKLMVALGLITAFVSMIIDNVTTVLLVAPVTLLVSDILGITALPILIEEVVLSNIGGVGTLVGDPPNIMISSASTFSFNDFLIHLMPISLIAIGISLLISRFLCSSCLVRREERVREILKMNEWDAIREKAMLLKCIIALIIVVVLFVTEEIHHLRSSFIALIGATITLILVRPDPKEVFSQIEWPVLLFFAALFVIVGGVDQAGFFKILANGITRVSSNPVGLTLIVIWFSFVLSSLIDNVPYTAAMIPIIKHIAALGVNTNPVWWALAIGVGFGGNGTPIGSSAGVVAMGLAERTKYPLTFKQWLKYGSIPALVTTGVASVLMVIGFEWFS